MKFEKNIIYKVYNDDNIAIGYIEGVDDVWHFSSYLAEDNTEGMVGIMDMVRISQFMVNLEKPE